MFDVQTFVFWVMALFTALCGLATVVTQNIVRSATWLLFTLAGASGVFFLLGADFVGSIQLLIYVGGTMVLVVFGVMLTAQGPFINMKTSGPEWAISALAGVLLMGVLCVGLSTFYTGNNTAAHEDHGKHEAAEHKTPAKYTSLAMKHAHARHSPEDPKDSRSSATIGLVLLGAPLGPVYEEKQHAPHATHYLLPFEIVSVHLLVVLIGAAYLARAKRHRGAVL